MSAVASGNAAAGGASGNEDVKAQYIGSQVSLISKSKIRWEGTLYDIDMTDSSIVLQNGASRRPPRRRVRPRRSGLASRREGPARPPRESTPPP